MHAIALTPPTGPFGNPDTLITPRTGIDLRKTECLQESISIFAALKSGKEIVHVARDTNDLMAYGIGTMIAKLCEKDPDLSSDLVFESLGQVFSKANLTKQAPYRLNRRTAFEHLQNEGFVHERLTIKTAKPASTLPTIAEIGKVVEEVTGFNLQQIQSSTRTAEYVTARFYAIWAMRFTCGHSLTHIGEYLGGRDHTSILNGINRVRNIRLESKIKSDTVDNICDDADLLALRRHHEILMRQSRIRRVS